MSQPERALPADALQDLARRVEILEAKVDRLAERTPPASTWKPARGGRR